MADRFQALITEIQAEYPGDDTWLVGAEHVHSQVSWPRIVTYLTRGRVGTSKLGARGRELPGGGIDDVIITRFPRVVMELWAANYDEAENRLHALLVAIFNVLGDSEIGVDGIEEEWMRASTQDITTGGEMVSLSFITQFDVLSSDFDVVDSAAAIGAGQSTEVVTSATIGITLDDESEPLEIEEP